MEGRAPRNQLKDGFVVPLVRGRLTCGRGGTSQCRLEGGFTVGQAIGLVVGLVEELPEGLGVGQGIRYNVG
eukprot:8922143-Pyramimonas_sp.AAC.1